jgi:dolichol-phosphate mannosyltransferase
MTKTRESGGRTCILLPVLNEAAHIDALWRGIRNAMGPRESVVCFVDDGSTDGTAEYLRSLARVDPARVHLIARRKMMRGSQRGSALYAALQWALSDSEVGYVVEMDGDLSHRPEELPIGLDLVASGVCDVAIASKYRPGSAVTNRPAARRAVSFVGNQIVRWLLTRRVTDYSNGFRFYNRRAALAIATSQIRYGSPIYLSEVVAIWLHDGFRIVEFDSTYVGRNEGLSKMRPLDLIKAVIAVCEIAWRYHTGRFARLHPEQAAVAEAYRADAQTRSPDAQTRSPV